GHHIYDGETGLCDELQSGNLYNVEISDVVKGERGKAGGLQASVNRLSQSIGEIKGNTSIGLYGTVHRKSNSDVYRIAEFGEAKMGHAQILTTINGTSPKFYDIDIVKVVSQNEVGEKGMVIAVRDKELLDKAGGIVQGMSGSPIVQNGLLIGAVTHVFISDPTRGYAVHSRFMFDKAEQVCSTLHIEKT
ncbi:MAG: SpoIVB peptidase S55 domain-containing protein, partial [Clostridia bacterium]